MFNRQIVTVGLCVPKSCSYKDIENNLNDYLQDVKSPGNLNITYSAKMIPQYCSNDRREEALDVYDISYM